MRTKSMAALLLALALLLSLTACGGDGSEGGGDADLQTPAAGVAVQVRTVLPDTIAAENKVSGQVGADDEAAIVISTAAKCTAVYFDAGDLVKAGDILCTLDLGSTLANYNAARIGYEGAVQSYQDQKTVLDKQVRLAEDNVANTKALFEIGAASQLEVDQAELNYDNAVAGRNAALNQLEAGIQSARSGMEQLDMALENVDAGGNVIAPISGTLVTMNAVEDSFISNSLPLAVIDGAEQMKVTVSVSEALVPKLSIGDTAGVTVSAANQSFDAVIRSVERAANFQTKLYTVTLTVPAEVTGLLGGMFADVTFRTDVSQDTLVVPTEAVLTSGDVQYVYVVEQDAARYREVVTGLTGSGVTEILSGVREGDQLVVVGQAYLNDGDAVRIVSGQDADGGQGASEDGEQPASGDGGQSAPEDGASGEA